MIELIPVGRLNGVGGIEAVVILNVNPLSSHVHSDNTITGAVFAAHFDARDCSAVDFVNPMNVTESSANKIRLVP